MIQRNEPVKNTCPIIDKLIKQINSIERELKYLKAFDLEENISSTVGEIESNIYDFEYDLEQLRSANSALRDWGNDCVSEYDKMERDYEEQIEEISKQVEP